MIGMEMPCNCYSCGGLVELEDMHFCVEGICECQVALGDRCRHGVCDECKEGAENG